MAYSMFFDDLQLPVVPEKIAVSVGNNNKELTLISDETVNVLRQPTLKQISFELLIPNTRYPFATYSGEFKDDTFYIQKLLELKNNTKSFRFIYTRTKPNGKLMYSVNMPVSMEECTFTESSANGTDIIAAVKLKEYREYGTKILKKSDNYAEVSSVREIQSAPVHTQYTIKKGDTLWEISKKYLGNGKRYSEIYELNRDVLKSPSLIYPGQVIKLPNISGGSYGY